ncbi:unknown [Prevotella sp. CAG:873]|nr:unknown [Prevotella sp. CAG:873]
MISPLGDTIISDTTGVIHLPQFYILHVYITWMNVQGRYISKDTFQNT